MQFVIGIERITIEHRITLFLPKKEMILFGVIRIYFPFVFLLFTINKVSQEQCNDLIMFVLHTFQPKNGNELLRFPAMPIPMHILVFCFCFVFRHEKLLGVWDLFCCGGGGGGGHTHTLTFLCNSISVSAQGYMQPPTCKFPTTFFGQGSNKRTRIGRILPELYPNSPRNLPYLVARIFTWAFFFLGGGGRSAPPPVSYAYDEK